MLPKLSILPKLSMLPKLPKLPKLSKLSKLSMLPKLPILPILLKLSIPLIKSRRLLTGHTSPPALHNFLSEGVRFGDLSQAEKAEFT